MLFEIVYFYSAILVIDLPPPPPLPYTWTRP